MIIRSTDPTYVRLLSTPHPPLSSVEEERKPVPERCLTVGNSRKHSAQTSIYMTSTSSSRMSTVTDASLPGERVTGSIQHLYVHIPFCARICPYCAFYKDLLDRSYTARFCEAIAAEIQAAARRMAIMPRTIFVGGGTPTALTTSQLEFLLNDMRKSLDLSQLEELTMEVSL